MLGEKANLKAPAVKGHRHPEATRKERRQGDHSNLTLLPTFKSLSALLLGQTDWKLEDKEGHQCNPLKSASWGRKQGRGDADKICRGKQMRSGSLY